ncbi:AF4/FMR2 family member 1 isoform 4-T4 [Podargus strigoides]
MNFAMAAQSSLYNEDRNLLRIREKERRNQEALQGKDKFPKTPVFPEPYKTKKRDELSSRIQNILGNYEEVKELINNPSHQNFIGILKSVAPLIPQGKPDRPYFPQKTSYTLLPSFHRTTHHPPMGPMVVPLPPPSHSIHYQKAQSRTEPASGLHAKSRSLSNVRSQGQEHNCGGGQEGHTGFHHKRNDRRVVGEGHANELQASRLVLSPLMASLSSPVAPLSPVHSSQHINSRSQNSSKSHGAAYSQRKSSQDLVTGSQEKESHDNSAVNVTSTTQPSSQTFPPPLPSKNSAMQQKPTAYVRPMDGQDQAPVESPELKPLLEEYHGEPYEKISDLKANAKAKLSKLEIPSEPLEQTFPCDVHSIEEILKPDPPTSNKWQLDNWLTKVNPPAAPTDSVSKIAHGDGHEEGKGQGVGSNSSHQHAEPREPHRKSSSRVARAPQDAHHPTKHNCQKSPVHAEEPSPRQTVGIKRPRKARVHKGPKGGLKVESEPGPFVVRDQSSGEGLKIKIKLKPKASDREDLKQALQEPPKKRKHKSSHQANTKPLLDPKPTRDVLLGSAHEHLTLSPLAQGQGTTPTSRSTDRPAIVAGEVFHKEKLPVPTGEKKLLSPVKDSPAPQSLIVKIDLGLLSRVPQPPGKDGHQKREKAKEHSGARKQDVAGKTMKTSDKSLRKRKREVKEEEIDSKKVKSEKETKSLQSSANKDSSNLKASEASFEMFLKKLLLPPPLPPMSPAHPSPKSMKKAQKRPRSESNELPAMDNAARNKSNHKDPLFSKHKKVEKNDTELLKDIKGSAGYAMNPFPVPSLPNGTSKPRRPQLKFEKQHPIEYYMEEAKRLKHKADAMTDKTGRAFQYLDAVLSFIEYGIALESDTTSPKSAYSIFSDTIDLIKFTMTLKSFVDSSASSHEKIFAVLCMRCQSVLHMATFHYKKDTAMKYSRILNDTFKSSSRVTQAPSPCVARSTGMPSPLSSTPSPASSVSSQPGSNASNSSGNSIASSVTVPYNIPSITASYVNITSHILYAQDIWEHADALARKNKEFFAELSIATCPLALNSSVTELVHYVRQGLQWLRLETNMP